MSLRLFFRLPVKTISRYELSEGLVNFFEGFHRGKGWSQNRVKIFYLYNVKIEGGRGSEVFCL